MAKKKAKPPKGKTCAELAKQFNRSVYSIRNWVTELTPVDRRGKTNYFDPSEVGKLLEGKVERSARSDSLKALEEQKLQLQVKKLENDLAIQTRDLLPADEVSKANRMLMTVVRSHLLGMAAELAPLLEGHPAHRIQEIITEHNTKRLTRLQDLEG